MDFLEKDLEDIIFENSQTDKGRSALFDRGLCIEGEMFRQVELGGYGRIDLLTAQIECFPVPWDEDAIYHPSFTVYELKKNLIDTNCLLQGMRYVEGIKHLYRNIYNCKKFNKTPEVSLVLIGNKVKTDDDFVFLYNNLNDVEIYTYDYKIDGIRFCRVNKNWYMTDPQFCNNTVNVLSNPGYGLLRSLIRADYEQNNTEEE